MGSEVSDADAREAQGVPGPTDKEDGPMNKEGDDGDSEANEEAGGDSLENKEEKSDVSSSASS